MLRQVAAVAIAFCLCPASVFAEDQVFTVSATSANVYKGPSTGSPVIGHASRGTALAVTRNLGSWVRVTWPEAPDGIGYVHVSMGTMASATSGVPTTERAAASAPTPGRSASPSRPAASPSTDVIDRRPGVVPVAQAVYVTPATHRIGAGAVVTGSTIGYGASARAWRRNHVGLQFAMAHSSMSNALVPGRLTTTRIEPSLMYSLRDHLSGSFWLRPYIGAGVYVRHETLADVVAGVSESQSDNALGMQAFGGGELTFAGAPQLALSADLTYHSTPDTFAGFDEKRVGFALSGHWYFR
jgi:hypothetical protein